MRTCKDNPNALCQEDNCIYYASSGACTYGNAVLCELYPDLDEYGHCVEDSCSSWDVVLGECTDQQDSSVLIESDK